MTRARMPPRDPSGSKNKARQAGELASPRDVLEWQSLVASCLSSGYGTKERILSNSERSSGDADRFDDIGDEFEVQSTSSSIFHLSDSSTHAGANWCKYIVADQDFRWGFLKALCSALRAPHGVLYRDAPLSTVIGVIRTLERYYGDLMDDIEVGMVHTVYETIRDCHKHVASGHKMNSDDVLALKCACLHSLTVMLVEVNLITRDHRLVKFHVDHLVRLLFEDVADGDVVGRATNLWLLKATASTCLSLMENDVRTLLSRQGAMYAREAMASEGTTALKGFPKTSLAVLVFAHACEAFEKGGDGSLDFGGGEDKCQFYVVAEDDNLSTNQRYHYPRHLERKSDAAPIVGIMTEYARATIAELFLFTMDAMKRMNAETIRRLSKPLRVLARNAGIEPHHKLWSIMYSLIDTGNVHIMEFVLDLHDEHPELFTGRRPCLLERIIARANDPAYSVDQRQLCLRWVMRQHANARSLIEVEDSVIDANVDGIGSAMPKLDEVSEESTGSFLLEDCWMQLLPADHDEPSTLHLRIKVLAGCLASNVGDAPTIMHGIFLWPGWTEPKIVEDKFMYAMRQLYANMDTAEYCDEAELRGEAAFIRAIIHASVTFPSTIIPIGTFLDLCDDTMRVRILAGFCGLFSQLDEQFEVLRAVDQTGGELPAPEISNFGRQKSSTTTLAGMVRGLSLRLSRRSINATAVEEPAPSSQWEMPGASRTGSLQVASATSSRKRLTSGGSDSRRSIESTSPVRDARLSMTNTTQTGGVTTLIDEPEKRSFGVMHRKLLSGIDLALPDMQHADELEEWILSERTWGFLKQAMLRNNDLLQYRSIIHRIVRRRDIVPCGVLNTISNYVWQYRSYSPCHALGTKEAGAAIIAIVQTAALAHLTLADEDSEPSYQQKTIVEALLEVLDAIQDGFPDQTSLNQADRFSKLVDDQNAWRPSRSLSTMAVALGGYIEAAVDVSSGHS